MQGDVAMQGEEACKAVNGCHPVPAALGPCGDGRFRPLETSANVMGALLLFNARSHTLQALIELYSLLVSTFTLLDFAAYTHLRPYLEFRSSQEPFLRIEPTPAALCHT